jgi:hypothetical protein
VGAYISYSFLTLALDGSEVVSLTPRLCFTPPGQYPWYPLDRRLGGLHSQSGHRGCSGSQSGLYLSLEGGGII